MVHTKKPSRQKQTFPRRRVEHLTVSTGVARKETCFYKDRAKKKSRTKMNKEESRMKKMSRTAQTRRGVKLDLSMVATMQYVASNFVPQS